MNVSLIDGDSIFYILAWQFRERSAGDEFLDAHGHVPLDGEVATEMYGAVDQFIIGILQATNADMYLGAIGDKVKCFRHQVAKFKPYKGKRGEPEPWYLLWKPVIEHRLREEWGFVSVPGLEADDIIALAHEKWTSAHKLAELDWIITVCSPDKDMRQLAGKHFDYKKLDYAEVTLTEAEYNLAFQMIAGDTTDGVAGIPGAGEKKAKEKLKEAMEKGIFPDQMVRSMYNKHFGDYYGGIIYQENLAVLTMMNTGHMFYTDCSWWNGDVLEERLQLRPVPEGIKQDSETLDTLKALGWGN